MKKIGVIICFILLIVFLIPSNSYGQTTLKPGIGINITDWSKIDNSNAKARVGWQVGASAAFGEKLYIEPGIYYQEQSTEITSDYTSSNFKFKNKITSLRIPVNVGLSIIGKEGSMLGLHVFGGPTASIVLNNDIDDLFDTDYSSVNWGIQAGAGVNVLLFYLDASYEWGLNEFIDDMDDSPKLKGFYLTAGIKL